MQRDMELIRNLLLLVEDQGDELNAWIEDVIFEGHTEEQINYHIYLLSNAGYLEAIDLSTSDGDCWRPRHLTWRGHEFLDAIRSDDIWRQTLKIAAAGGNKGIEAIWEIAKAMAQKEFEKLIGLAS